MKKKGVVLFSGGIDSTTVMAIAKNERFEIYALSFDYGQRHSVEVEKAKKIAPDFGVKEHLILSLALDKIGGSALVCREIPVPKRKQIGKAGERIPPTYVPARNTIFLSYALAWSEVLGAEDIFIGVNAIDYSGYPDCRMEYINAFEKMAGLATKAGVEGGMHFRIHTPLISLSKAEIIKKGIDLGVDYALSHSCYDPLPDGRACGECESCQIRRKGFKEAGIEDPTQYG